MAEAFSWWLGLEVLGLIAFPYAFVLLRQLPDRGYTIAKPLGLLLLSYSAWMLGMLHILPNQRGSLIIILALLSAGGLLLLGRAKDELVAFWRSERRTLLATEAVFLVLFLLLALIRAYNPDIAATEKPMDFGFLNASFRAEFFPPPDPWLSGYSISYYYFGYLMQAILTKLVALPPSFGFNLDLASTFALAALGALGLVYNLVRADGARRRQALTFGLLGGIMLIFLANLEGALEMLHAHGVGDANFWSWVGVKGLDHPYQSATWYPSEAGWWWWRATRVIDTVVGSKSLDYTITEFPFFSFLLGDLHPHVMALPMNMTALALSLNFLRSEEAYGISWMRSHWGQGLLAAVILGALGFLNSWDLPTYGGLFALALLLQAWRRRGSLWGSLAAALVVGLLAFLLYLPFYGFILALGGEVARGGYGGLPIGLWTGLGSRPLHLWLLWGLFWLIGGALLFRVGQRQTERRNLALAAVALPVLMWLGAELAGVAGVNDIIMGSLRKMWMAPPLVLTLFLLSRRLKPEPPDTIVLEQGESIPSASTSPPHDSALRSSGTSLTFVLALLAASLAIFLGTEFFFLRDVFSNRMNTVFKLYYQAWAFLAGASAFGLYYLWFRWQPTQPSARWGQRVWLGLVLVVGVASLLYPVTATFSKTNGFSTSPTLDGLAFVRVGDPAEAAALDWLNTQVKGTPVIVEATGDEWSDYGRISSRTGLPTILGWAGHEVQWRGSDRLFRGRDEAVARIYQSHDQNEVTALLEQYDVSYIFVGRLERSRYPGLPGAFRQLAEEVFRQGEVSIYRVKGRGALRPAQDGA